MNTSLSNFIGRLKARLIPLADLSAWVLLILAVPLMLMSNPAMVGTLLQWSAFGVALAGIAVMLCRLIFPMINLGDWLDLIWQDMRYNEGKSSMPAAIIVAAVIFAYIGLFLGLVLWAKT